MVVVRWPFAGVEAGAEVGSRSRLSILIHLARLWWCTVGPLRGAAENGERFGCCSASGAFQGGMFAWPTSGLMSTWCKSARAKKEDKGAHAGQRRSHAECALGVAGGRVIVACPD